MTQKYWVFMLRMHLLKISELINTVEIWNGDVWNGDVELGTNVYRIRLKIQNFSFMKMHFKMSAISSGGGRGWEGGGGGKSYWTDNLQKKRNGMIRLRCWEGQRWPTSGAVLTWHQHLKHYYKNPHEISWYPAKFNAYLNVPSLLAWILSRFIEVESNTYVSIN